MNAEMGMRKRYFLVKSSLTVEPTVSLVYYDEVILPISLITFLKTDLFG